MLRHAPRFICLLLTACFLLCRPESPAKASAAGYVPLPDLLVFQQNNARTNR